MHFKRLELLGFKSFCDKTVLDFEPGITAVVGPNGCGKSNIFDAIRWVLGEQSVRAMRGNRMEDVIFNGTDKRPAVGFAEVSLTFSNESKIIPVEYDEVTVTRRLFRSGESEYLLNKNVVRLKDILELFMGTGIGAESYSLVEQGKIDLIISSKPEERRLIFDEAAGITKYKSKKRETLNKLQDTENNLLRINDIITEVKRQINSLERQASKARRYREEFDRLKEMEIQMAKFDLGRLEKEKNELLLQLKELSEKEALLTQQTDAARQCFATENERISALDAKINEVNAQIIRLDGEVEMNRRHISLNKERIAETQTREARIKLQKEELVKVLAEQETKVNTFKEEMSALLDTVSQNTAALKKKQLSLEEINQALKQAQEAVARAKKNILEVSADQSKTRNELTEIFAQAQGLLARKRRLDLEKLKVASEKDQVEGNLKSIEEEIGSSDSKIKDLTGQRINLGLECENLKREAEAVREKISRAEAQVVRLESQREFLEDLKLQYQDMPEAINGLLFSVDPPKGNLVGILGKVKGVMPIEENHKQAAEEILKGADIGKLRRIICETKFVDLDPQKIIARITEVKQEIESLQRKEAELGEALKEKTAGLTQLENLLHQEEILLSSKETQREAIREEFDKLNAESELVVSELSDTQRNLEELAQKEERLKKIGSSLEEKYRLESEVIHSNEELISRKSLEREQEKVAFAQLETELASLKEKEANANDTLKMLEDALNREKHNLDTLLLESDQSQEKIKSWEAEIAALELKSRQSVAAKDSLRFSLEAETSRREELAGSLKASQSRLSAFEEEITQFKNLSHSLQMQEQEINFKTQGLKERMLQAYKINIEETAGASAEGVNFAELGAAINKLKEKLEAYGTVNLVAIEEFDELKQRFEFLTQQQNDLLAAKESLHSTILKINRTTRQLFTDTFEKVTEEFKVYFRALFGGGEAQLLLLDPEDVLESGIEIVARPPGKKLQNISLLSGGEKSLTAIALIFAVFKVRPSPFCVVDEIDAALDESNVGRFSAMLKEFTHSSQFIVITHNKKTIVNADVMYGITMQETGVSKIVSVKFSDRKREQQGEPEVAAVV
ncbi:MAG: chromosome segregation SMC family protein [Candidatus Omnitrophota bacterium]